MRTSWSGFGRGLAIGCIALAGILADGPGAGAQPQPSADFGERLFMGKARCAGCHGWAGDGIGMEAYTGGANLRETMLGEAEIRETIRCGRPGTAMPSHDRAAFRSGACTNTVGGGPLGVSLQQGVWLHPREIEALTRYIWDNLRGRGAVSAAECRQRWGEASPLCTHLSHRPPEP